MLPEKKKEELWPEEGRQEEWWTLRSKERRESGHGSFKLWDDFNSFKCDGIYDNIWTENDTDYHIKRVIWLV